MDSEVYKNPIAIVVMLTHLRGACLVENAKGSGGERNECRIHSQRNHFATAAVLFDVRTAETGEVLNLGAQASLPADFPGSAYCWASRQGCLRSQEKDR
jgi:hypothetical protein